MSFQEPFLCLVGACCSTAGLFRKTIGTSGLSASASLREHFQKESREHLAALRQGRGEPASPVHFWRGGPKWALGTLLLSGYDVFLLGKRPGLCALVKEGKCPWTAYQALPLEARLEYNATAYDLTADRCRIVKGVVLDPPRRVEDARLLEALSAFTPSDTAQLIIDFAVDPYLPHHLRCCASTAQNHRCPYARCRRYCPVPPVGCCKGFKVAPHACLYDVCSFHLLRKKHNQPVFLVSCD